jgi:hypothetical protein
LSQHSQWGRRLETGHHHPTDTARQAFKTRWMNPTRILRLSRNLSTCTCARNINTDKESRKNHAKMHPVYDTATSSRRGRDIYSLDCNSLLCLLKEYFDQKSLGIEAKPGF